MSKSHSVNNKASNPKNYILDISTLIFSPYSILAFDDNNVIIPLSCVKELNRSLEKTGDTRANARECSRLLSSLAEQGSLSQGIRLENGGLLRVIGDIDQDIFHIAEEHKRENYIIVSRNPNVRIIANQKGIRAEDYKSEQVSSNNADYEGRSIVYVSQEEIDSFKKKGGNSR